jgi:hypothetical protein
MLCLLIGALYSDTCLDLCLWPMGKKSEAAFLCTVEMLSHPAWLTLRLPNGQTQSTLTRGI